MFIRKATIEDSGAIAALLLSAMEDLVFKFLGGRNRQKALAFVLHFVQMEETQHSWRNCFVGLVDDEVVCAASVYDGARLQELREPMVSYARNVLQKDFQPEDETGPGEFYIDSLGVPENCRGKGYGSQMLEFLIDEFALKQGKILGLLVDEDNPSAKKLYVKLGFRVVGKQLLAGKSMEHLQFRSS